MTNTLTIREKATLVVDFDTWRDLNQLKTELGLKTIDDTIKHLIKENGNGGKK
ncbi:MAG: hypothetical protein WED07_00985 [Candidatus Freyarchaeum deiterrae]